jgi:hypothetical protein
MSPHRTARYSDAFSDLPPMVFGAMAFIVIINVNSLFAAMPCENWFVFLLSAVLLFLPECLTS